VLLLAMCVAGLPVTVPVLIATLPLWQEWQVPLTCVWSTVVAGIHATALWQLSHVLPVARCVGALPVAVVPSWQPLQPLVMPAWTKDAGVHVSVVWQVPHSCVAFWWIGSVGLAVTTPVLSVSEPLWQLMQLPETAAGICVWSTRSVGLHATVLWQLSQVSLLTM
jgi:hypothetical protein